MRKAEALIKQKKQEDLNQMSSIDDPTIGSKPRDQVAADQLGDLLNSQKRTFS